MCVPLFCWIVSRTQSHSAGQSKPPASTGHDNSGRSADVATSSYTTPSVDNANNTSGTPNVTRRPFKHSDTICLRKVPPELNDLAKLGAHFQKFGKVVNIEVSRFFLAMWSFINYHVHQTCFNFVDVYGAHWHPDAYRCLY